MESELVFDCSPSTPIGIPTLAKMALEGSDLSSVWNSLVTRVNVEPRDAAAFMDLSTIAYIQGRPKDRSILRSRALELQRIYRQAPATTTTEGVRLLAFMSAADYLPNMPIEFLLKGSSVTLDMLYIVPGRPLPQPLPEHDVALVAVAESGENQSVLQEIAALVPSWPRPVINRPDRIARLTRDGTWHLLRDAVGVVIPMNVRIDRSSFAQMALGEVPVECALDGKTFPIIARPVDSHLGEGLSKLDSPTAMNAYLQERPESEFYIAPFMDYSGPDGLFRKYRIALIDGRPYAVHMAVAQHWMINYINADMKNSAQKRAEEERFMLDFDVDFAVRHRIALNSIAERIGLEYLPFDCAETHDGKLLVFETGTNMIVHALDSPEIFPYKRPQMNKVFAAFREMLINAVRKGS